MDIAILPATTSPARFHAQVLYEEEFVLAMRAGHAFSKSPTLDGYCEAEHLVVSQGGDGHGFVDELLAEQGRSRRVALTVPNFMFALSVIAETDLVSALPRRFVELHAARYGVAVVEPPLPLGTFQLRAVAPHAAMMDAGLDWLFALLAQSRPGPAKKPTRRPARARK